MTATKKPTFVKKLSTKTITKKKRPDVPTELGTVKHLYDVIGVAGSVITGQSDFGPWNKLIGSFQATNLENGEVFRSGACFLPGVAENMVLGTLSSGVESVQFGFRIGVVKDDDSSVGYVFVAEPLFPPAANDPLEKMSKDLLQLEHKQEDKQEQKQEKKRG